MQVGWHRSSRSRPLRLPFRARPWRCLVIVSAALSLMLTLSGALVPPDGCAIVVVAEDGSAVAACTDPHTWFVYDPELTHNGLWSLTHTEPLGLVAFHDLSPNDLGLASVVRG